MTEKRADKQAGDIAALPDPAQGDEGFLTRWSRRKQAIRSGEDVADEPAPPSDAAELEWPQATVPEQPELTDADMPPIETLDENSDYSAFLSPKVSEDLRRLALRKLFHLPQFNITDGLNDYDEDYTNLTELGGIVTHEMRRMLEREKQRAMAAGPRGDEEAPKRTGDHALQDIGAGASSHEDGLTADDPDADPAEDLT